jgi:hypothetical protein
MGNVGHPMIYSRAWSIGGHIVKNFNKELLATWSHKVFGYDVPTQVEPYFNSKMTSTIYDIRVNQLYQTLCNRYAEEIKAETALGPVTEIGDHYYIRNNVKEEFDHAVNTIPLPQFNKLAGYESKVKAKTIHYLHIETEDLNFEGHNQLMVADEHFGFYKVTNIAPKRFLFYCHEDLVNPGVYMMQFMNKFDIIDGTSIQDVVPSGQIPKLEYLEELKLNSSKKGVEKDVLNGILTDVIKETGDACKLLHSALVSWPVRTSRDTSVFTGFAFEIPKIKEYVKECLSNVSDAESGDKITFPFCISTSVNKQVATKLFTSSDEQIVLEIILPTGSPFPFISTEGIEAEVLLPFGCRLQFVSEKFEDDRPIYVFRYEGQMPEDDFNAMIDRNVVEITELYKLRVQPPRGAAVGGKRKSKKRKTRKTKKRKSRKVCN